MFALYLKLVDPIENRCKDEEVRGQATRDLLKFILDHKTAAKSLPTPEQEAVDSECTKAEQWLRERSQLQESLPKNVDPALWSHEINKKKNTSWTCFVETLQGTRVLQQERILAGFQITCIKQIEARHF
jgi:hypothetical protein